MTAKPTNLVLLVAMCLCFTGCTPVILGLYGLRDWKPIEEKSIEKYAGKYQIPLADVYELDSSYISFVRKIKDAYPNVAKNHFQPLQALYYNNTGHLQSYHINCNAGGFPNLLWNRDGIMTQFPPGQQTPPDSLLPLFTHVQFMRPFPGTASFVPQRSRANTQRQA
jgi:hypothetical protein